ncbi:hypothetical protein [Acinetobacter phage Ab69]|nr:hypothetical protein [Acinetobacter phage Ab69]
MCFRLNLNLDEVNYSKLFYGLSRSCEYISPAFIHFSKFASLFLAVIHLLTE